MAHAGCQKHCVFAKKKEFANLTVGAPGCAGEFANLTVGAPGCAGEFANLTVGAPGCAGLA